MHRWTNKHNFPNNETLHGTSEDHPGAPKLRISGLRINNKFLKFYSKLYICPAKSDLKAIFNCPSTFIIELPQLTKLNKFQ